MASGKTNHYQLDYLLSQQLTSKDVLMDQRRFTTIDNNLYALYQIFGNGIIVIESTEFPLYVETFTDSNAIKKIKVTPGRAIVNYKSINYTTTTELNLPSQAGTTTSQKYYLYLKDTNDTVTTQLGEFVFSSEKLSDTVTYIGIGAIQVDYANGTATFYDDSQNGRQIINIKKIFLNFINSHSHAGGIGNPKKIDLTSEVSGILSPEYIGGVNADQIQGGQISQFVSPQMDHERLNNTGTLTHSQIDAALLAFNENLNLEIVNSVNQLKLTGNIIATSTESTIFTNPAVFPSGSIANIDRGTINSFVYVPNVTSDLFLVGFNGITGSSVPNNATCATGPKYTQLIPERIARIQRTDRQLCVNESGTPSSNVQCVSTFQQMIPQSTINKYGQVGYFAGFVPGISYYGNSGCAHLIHNFISTTGSTPVDEAFQNYILTDVDSYNSMLSYGNSGVQIACLLTNLTDFVPSSILNDSTYNHVVYSAASTGPRVLSLYNNGYLSSTTPTAFFLTTGPQGIVKSFYYETSTGPRAALFSGGALVANLGYQDYLLRTSGNGKFNKLNSKIIFNEYASTAINLYELGPTGASLVTPVVTNATNITQSSVYSYNDSADYRVFYIDNNRLNISEPNGITQLGYFNDVYDIIAKNNRIFILSNENNAKTVFFAYQSGSPIVFNQIYLAVSGPNSNYTIDTFKNSSINKEYIVVRNDYNLYVFNINGKLLYNYTQGRASSSGPRVRIIYNQFDLGSATVDMKYG